MPNPALRESKYCLSPPLNIKLLWKFILVNPFVLFLHCEGLIEVVNKITLAFLKGSPGHAHSRKDPCYEVSVSYCPLCGIRGAQELST